MRDNTNSNNNLSILKYFASILVIISHGLSLTGLSNPIISSFGEIAVSFFFFVSGYYSVKNIEKYKSDKIFVKKRMIAIFPPLIEVALLSIFVIGPMCTKLSLKDYFSDINTYKYLLIIFMIRIHSLPGVFENNIYGNEVNGSLWTMPFQCICYLMIIIVNKIKLFKNKIFITLIAFVSLFFELIMPYIFEGYYYQVISYGYRSVIIFLIGVEFYYWKDKISISYKNIFIILITAVLLYYFGFKNAYLYIFLPYMVYCLIFTKHQIKINTSFLGKLSYPIYLLAFPIQQTLVFLSNNSMSYVWNWLFTIVICMVLGSILLVINDNFKRRIKI